MFRFLHLADVHLGLSMGKDALVQTLAQARRDSWNEAIQAALTEKVHAVLIAGDLIHEADAQMEDFQVIQEGMNRLHQAGITVCYARGNHDPADLCPLNLPEWVEVFDARFARMCQIRDQEGHPVGAVVGAGFDTAVIHESLLPTYPPRHNQLPTVGLLHTQLIEENGRDTGYAPASLSQLDALHYDYWALGHIHRRSAYNASIHYPGSLMATDRGELGLKGGLLVEVGAFATPQVRFLSLGKVQLVDIQLENLASCQNRDALVAAAVTQLENLQGQATPLVRIHLDGEAGCLGLLTGPGAEGLLQSMAAEIQDRTGAWQVELLPGRLLPVSHAVTLRQRRDLLGELMNLTADARDGGPALAALETELSRMGLAGCRNTDLQTKMAYIQILLRDLEPNLMERMRK